MAMNDYSDNDYWKALAERFFEAGTSEEEERELRRFITSGLAGSEFNDVRAVMGLAAAADRKTVRRRRRTVFLSAAAASPITALTSLNSLPASPEVMNRRNSRSSSSEVPASKKRSASAFQ